MSTALPEHVEKMAENWPDLPFPLRPDDWQAAPAEFTEGKLLILGHPVMEDWELPLMQELARIASCNLGVILEVGFGLGLSASHIQTFPITRHIIIEANAGVFTKLQEFAQFAKRPVQPVFGIWQDVISTIPDESVDGILFDTYAFNYQDLQPCPAVAFFPEAYRVLKKGGIFTYFSNEVEDFSPAHLERLQAAGFRNIDKEVYPVNPPKDCLYWMYNTIVAPIIRK